MSILLFLACVLITAAYWDERLELMGYQLSALYASLGCTAVLLFGTFVSIPILYVPAVYIMVIFRICLAKFGFHELKIQQ
jgi:hypothetical protein